MRVRIEKLVYQGYGLARHNGKTLFVQRSAPGDLADVQIVESKKSYDLARVENLIETSPDRVDPPCLFFKQGCGGCQWQHLQYQTQLKWKRNIFLEFLHRNHFAEPFPEICVIASPEFHYRTRFQFHLTGSGEPALFREQSHDLVPVNYCWLLPEALNQVLHRLAGAPWLAGCDSFQIWLDDLGQVGLETTWPLEDAAMMAVRRDLPDLKILHPRSKDRMEYHVGNLRILVGTESFFQTNRFLNPTLSETVCRLAGGGGTLLDLYSGIGFFSLAASPRFARVVGVEESRHAVEHALANARLNGTDNVTFWTGRVEQYVEKSREKFDCVLADPPRAGLSKRTIRWILNHQPRHLIYVSCDPTTLVRDVQWLSARYEARQFLLFDLFPQTFHFEVVAELLARV
ncbi:MAG TPA: class I SAM-dependent RNA methyltransferase [Acidobacteriota bacterium]|nr:class I SAM-dependent RNA methyltransferase [Acidobacteriota bacterium]